MILFSDRFCQFFPSNSFLVSTSSEFRFSLMFFFFFLIILVSRDLQV